MMATMSQTAMTSPSKTRTHKQNRWADYEVGARVKNTCKGCDREFATTLRSQPNGSKYAASFCGSCKRKRCGGRVQFIFAQLRRLLDDLERKVAVRFQRPDDQDFDD